MGWLIVTALAKLFGMVIVFAHVEHARDIRAGRVVERVPCARVVRR